MLVVANLGLHALMCILRTLAGREGNPWAVGCAAAWSSGVEGAHIPGSSGDLCHTCPCRMYMCMYVETCQAALMATAETHNLLGENVSKDKLEACSNLQLLARGPRLQILPNPPH